MNSCLLRDPAKSGAYYILHIRNCIHRRDVAHVLRMFQARSVSVSFRWRYVMKRTRIY